MEELKNGYVIKMMHEHYPTMQRLIRLKKEERGVEYQRYKDRAKGLRDFFFFFDYVLTHRIEFKGLAFSMSQNWIRKNFQNGEFFKLFVEINFTVTRHDSLNRKAREYILLDSFKSALYKIVQMAYKENKEKELNSIYVISEPKKIQKYYKLPFSKSLLYDKGLTKIDNSYFSEVNGIININPYIKFLDKEPLKSIGEASLNFSQKKDVKYIYSLTKREYDALSKVSGKDFYTFDFVKSRIKIKQVQSKSKIKEYVNTKVILNNKVINEIIEKYRIDTEKFIYIFSFFNLLRHYEKGTNYILYEQKKFRLYSTKELNFGINFQSIPSIFRSVIFKEQYDYDINAGAPTLLYQYLQKKMPNNNIKLEYLESYIKDRKVLRKKCAEVLVKKFGGKENDYEKGIKQVITAMLYGSNILYNGDKNSHKLGFEKRKYLYYNIDELKGLSLDLKKLFDDLEKHIKSLKVLNEKYELENDVYIDVYETIEEKKEKKKINSVVSEIYFYLESKILYLMYKTYKEDISLLIHDGFICRKDIEVKELEKLVKDKLDYDVRYSKDKL